MFFEKSFFHQFCFFFHDVLLFFYHNLLLSLLFRHFGFFRGSGGYLDDHVARGVLVLLKSIAQLGAVVGIQRAQNGHVLDELLEFVSFLSGGLGDHIVEGVTVQLPQNAIFLRDNTGGGKNTETRNIFTPSYEIFAPSCENRMKII